MDRDAHRLEALMMTETLRNPVPTSLELAMRQLGPALSRVAVETVGAFFGARALPSLDPGPGSKLGGLRASQKCLGRNYGMICNLAATGKEWERLFPTGTQEAIRLDALCELVNCLCGNLTADPGFSDGFGHLLPCVPEPGAALAPAGSHSLRGSLLVRGTRIHFAVSVFAETRPA